VLESIPVQAFSQPSIADMPTTVAADDQGQTNTERLSSFQQHMTTTSSIVGGNSSIVGGNTGVDAKFNATVNTTVNTTVNSGAITSSDTTLDISLGDRMLQNLHNLNNEFNASLTKVEQTVMQTDISPQDLLRTQLELLKFGLQNEFINKIVSKSTQHLDTMVKSQ